MPLEMDFCDATELSMVDPMDWAFLALLCDYTLGTLFILAQFYPLKPHHFRLRLQRKPFSTGFHLPAWWLGMG